MESSFSKKQKTRWLRKSCVRATYVYNYYTSPDWSYASFLKIPEELLADVRYRHLVIITGYWNAWAVEWGSRVSIAKSSNFLWALAVPPVTLLNGGQRNTFRKARVGSVINITFVSHSLATKSAWMLRENYSNRDPKNILLDINVGRGEGKRCCRLTEMWNVSAFDKKIVRMIMLSYGQYPPIRSSWGFVITESTTINLAQMEYLTRHQR